jgi:DNA-binding SARP family transcriptional activator
VLALLLLHANDVVPRERLIDELWGEERPETARTALQVHVSQLRKLLGSERIATQAPGYVLRVEPDELDLERFQGLVAQARGLEPAAAAASLRRALALWTGSPLAELEGQAFAERERLRLEELHLAALEARVEADLLLGRHSELVPELERLVAEHPLRERLRGQLMLALYRSGRQAEALEAYRQGRRLLADELGLEPGEELTPRDGDSRSGSGARGPRFPSHERGVPRTVTGSSPTSRADATAHSRAPPRRRWPSTGGSCARPEVRGR